MTMFNEVPVAPHGPARPCAGLSSRVPPDGAGHSGHYGSPAPFVLGHGIDHFVGPLALNDLVLDEMGLAAHAESLQDAGRCGVPAVDPAEDAMQAQAVET